MNGTGEGEFQPPESSSKSRVRLSTPKHLLQRIRKVRQLFSPKQGEHSKAVLGTKSVLITKNEELEDGQHSEDIGWDGNDDVQKQEQQQQLSLVDLMKNIKEPWFEDLYEDQGIEERNRTHPPYTRGSNLPVLIQPGKIRSLFLVMDEIPWSTDAEQSESVTGQSATTKDGPARETVELEQTPQASTLLSNTSLYRSRSLPSTPLCHTSSILVSSGSDDTKIIKSSAIETFTFTIPVITTVAQAAEPPPRPAPVLFDGMTSEELIRSIRFENDREGSPGFYGAREYERDQEKRRLARVGVKTIEQQEQDGFFKRASKGAEEAMEKAKSLTSLPVRMLFGADSGLSDDNGSGSGSGSGGSGQTSGRVRDKPSTMGVGRVGDAILETVSEMASTMWTRATATLIGRIPALPVNREEKEEGVFLPGTNAKAAYVSTAESNHP